MMQSGNLTTGISFQKKIRHHWQHNISQEISVGRITAISLTMILHVSGLLFLTTQEERMPQQAIPEEVTMTVEFIPLKGDDSPHTPPAPPSIQTSQIKAKATTSQSVQPSPPVADVGEEKSEIHDLLLASQEASSIDVPAPDYPPTEILTYRSSHQPVFPPDAKASGESGWVTLRVLVNEEGLPEAFVLVRNSASTRLVNAAIEAIKNWRFNPAMKNGAPVTAWIEVPIGFYNSLSPSK